MAGAALLYTDSTGASYRHQVFIARHNAGIDRMNRQAAVAAAMPDTDTRRWLPEPGRHRPVIYRHPDDYAANKRVKPKTRRQFEHACALRDAT